MICGLADAVGSEKLLADEPGRVFRGADLLIGNRAGMHIILVERDGVSAVGRLKIPNAPKR